jgi:hypothetical protein
MQLRDYQNNIALQGVEILKEFQLLYLAMQVRTGKTITSLHTAKLYGAKNVLFATKKKAVSSIEKDFESIGKPFNMWCINYESLHKCNENFDFLILDEAHCLGQYPQPAERVKELKRIAANKPIIYLSGTPTPESYSQFYHQFYISSFSPFVEKKFYEWHKNYGVPAVKFLYNRQINDYSKTKKEAIIEKVQHLILSYTQEEAGFTSFVEEKIIKLPMPTSIKWAIDKLKKDKIITTKEGKVILGDTAVKEMNKTHQLCGGTVKLEDGNSMIIDSSKAEYIKEKFAGQKIAIYYKYIAEGEAIRWAFAGRIVQDPEEFNKSGNNAVFISQVQSGREGVNLSSADCLIMYNIDFSSVSYWQVRARLQTKDREKEAIVYWLFFDGGIEQKIYNVVQGKKDFTLSHYKKNNYER